MAASCSARREWVPEGSIAGQKGTSQGKAGSRWAEPQLAGQFYGSQGFAVWVTFPVSEPFDSPPTELNPLLVSRPDLFKWRLGG